MNRFLALCLLGLLSLAPVQAGTLYIKTTGAATNSGTSDTNAAKVGSASATITCSATTYTGSTPGCSLSGSPDLSATVTSGATQDAIYIGCATNTNQKIFWITAVNDGSDLVQTVGTITGCTSATAAWAIGGRHILTNASIEGALRAGDTALFEDTPTATSAAIWTFRNAGDSTSGPALVQCSSTAVLLEATSTTPVFTPTLFNTGVVNCGVKEDGASGQAFNISGTNFLLLGNKIQRAGGTCVSAGQTIIAIGNEITGCATDGINLSSSQQTVRNNYIHNLTGDCVEDSAATPSIELSFNILYACGGMGFNQSNASVAAAATQVARVANNTVYGNTGSGIGFADVDSPCVIENNIIENNASGSGANLAGQGTIGCTGEHQYNIVYQSGAGTNLSNFVLNATEQAVDPLMTLPGSGNFVLQATSPAKGLGYPGVFVGGNTGYISMGAVQPNPASAGGGIIGG